MRLTVNFIVQFAVFFKVPFTVLFTVSLSVCFTIPLYIRLTVGLTVGLTVSLTVQFIVLFTIPSTVDFTGSGQSVYCSLIPLIVAIQIRRDLEFIRLMSSSHLRMRFRTLLAGIHTERHPMASI